MLDQITILLGGRVAEEMIFGEITSGASNDIEKADKTGASNGVSVRDVRRWVPERLV